MLLLGGIFLFDAISYAEFMHIETESRAVKFTSTFFKKAHFFYASTSDLFEERTEALADPKSEPVPDNTEELPAKLSLIQSLKTRDSGKIISRSVENVGITAVFLALPLIFAVALKYKILMKGAYILLPISSLVFIWVVAEANYGVRRVFFDNAFDSDVTIYFDEEKVIDLPGRSFCRIDMIYGSHLVKIVEDATGTILDHS